MNPLVLWVTDRGREVAERLCARLAAESARYRRDLVEEAFLRKRPLVFIGACGIAVRAIAPFLRHKSLDPAVVVVDEAARFAVSLLSGHLGGANALARQVAEILSAEPVITTASDVRGLVALDLWLRELGVEIGDFETVKRLQAELLARESLRVFLEPPLSVELPAGLVPATEEEADLRLTYRRDPGAFHPRCLCLGLGFHAEEEALAAKVRQILRQNGLAEEAVLLVATINRPGREERLKELARELSVGCALFEGEELAETDPPSPSRATEFLKLPGVAEPVALLAAEGGPLILPKQSADGITLAAAVHRRLAR